MIAYLLLRVAAREPHQMPALRLAELACQCLLMRRPIAEIDKPPSVNPSGWQRKFSADQLVLSA